jgi:hypothetical protein
MLIAGGTKHQRTPVEELVDRRLPGMTGATGERVT